MWLACHSQEEIAEQVGVPRESIRDLAKTENFPISPKFTFQDDFQPPTYNYWLHVIALEKTSRKVHGVGYGFLGSFGYLDAGFITAGR